MNKAFDRNVHDFLTVSLIKSLNLWTVTSQTEELKQKINNFFSDPNDLLIGLPQGSVLRSFVFSVYICDIIFFIEEENATSYADDTAHWYSSGNNVATVLEDIEVKGKTVFHWFSMNHLKANTGKSQHFFWALLPVVYYNRRHCHQKLFF